MGVCTCCNRRVSFFKLGFLVPDLNGTNHKICDDCMNRVQKEGKAFKWNPQKGIVEIVEKDEAKIIKKCNDCGYIFTYTALDKKNNENLRTTAALQAISSVTGSALTNAVNESNYQQTSKKIRDFNRCPQCNSTDLKELTLQEYRIEREKRTNENSANYSPADELIKFKELLDKGIISQEEFEAKKKQLLGL